MENISCFNEAKHSSNEWNTSIINIKNSVLRALIGYISQKRKHVDKLAKNLPLNSIILDAGCGKGAYSIWLLNKKKFKVVCADISFVALKQIKSLNKKKCLSGKLMPVCADLCYLPFKHEVFDGIFSIDVLGHVKNIFFTLNEFFRCAKKNSLLFLHSECNDYQKRWPDKMLYKKTGKDILAQLDGHINLLGAQELFIEYSRRFYVLWFDNPAGYFGWLLGYPEKYSIAFEHAKIYHISLLLKILGKIKKMPLLGILLRFINATTNHIETFLGLSGGGSCFAFLKKP
jgi:ubiquinone/menaquinone biosynthesis C-methylase UbiE